ISRSSSAPIRPTASSSCPNAGSSSEPSPGSADAEGSPRIGSASIARRSPSSSSRLSASCCENYAIQDDVSGQTLRRQGPAASIGSRQRRLRLPPLRFQAPRSKAMHETARRRKLSPEAPIEDEIAQLRDLDLKGLRARWQSIFQRSPAPHLPRHLLFAVLAFRIQADR